MNVVCVDPVSAVLLPAGVLSFVTVDRPPPPADCTCRTGPPLRHMPLCPLPGPSPWIGQRVAIYADPKALSRPVNEADQWIGPFRKEDGTNLSLDGRVIPLTLDAIVGSGTLAEALPILTYKGHTPHDGPLDAFGIPACIEVYRDDLLWWTHHDGGFRSIKDQLPLQSWEPGRWALRFTDVAPTSERCPWCGGSSAVRCDHAGCDAGWHWVECPVCIQDDCEVPVMPVVAPVLSGDDPTYKEWTP